MVGITTGQGTRLWVLPKTVFFAETFRSFVSVVLKLTVTVNFKVCC